MTGVDKERLAAIRVIESLRAGVPTRASTRELPDLREELTDWIKRDLEEFGGGSTPQGRLIWGQYGQGKTHVLTTAEHLALDKNFAVSLVSLSREVSCHNLQHFYGRVASRIRVPDSTLYGVYKALSKKYPSELPDSPIQQPGRYAHPLPSVVLEEFFYAPIGEEQDLLYGDLTGIKLPLPELKRIRRQNRQIPFPRFDTNFKASEHMTAYFGLMADMIKFCGYAGWVILIDEVELIGRLGVQARLKAYRNLQWLLNVDRKQKFPIYVVAAAASRLQDDLWYGSKHDDREEMPQIALQRIGEEAAQELKGFFRWAVSDHNLIVTPVRQEDLRRLLQRVSELHGIAYQWQADIDWDRLLKHLGSTTVRTYIRATLEVLDQKLMYQDFQLPGTLVLDDPKIEEDTDFFSEETMGQV